LTSFEKRAAAGEGTARGGGGLPTRPIGAVDRAQIALFRSRAQLVRAAFRARDVPQFPAACRRAALKVAPRDAGAAIPTKN